MERKGRSPVLWIVGALVLGLSCCICTLILIAVAVFSVRDAVYESPILIPEEEIPSAVWPTPTPAVFPLEPEWEEGRSVAKLMLDELGRIEVPMADPVQIAEKLLGLEGLPRVIASHAETLEEGARQTFWVTNTDSNESFEIEAKLGFAGEIAYLWVEVGLEVDSGDILEVMEDFEQEIYPTNRSFFGSEWSPGVDGDEHLHILFSRGLGNSVAGLFSPMDSYPPSVHEYSNGHEMFYLNADSIGLNSSFTRGVLAHELAHMIHWNQDRNEDTWMDEGAAELAVYLNGHDLGGSDLAFTRNTDQTLNYWPAEGDTTPHYGQGFLFFLYFMERFGQAATKSLIASPKNGLESIDIILQEPVRSDLEDGSALTAEDVFTDWGVALLLQGESLDSERYQFLSYQESTPVRFSDSLEGCPEEPQLGVVRQFGLDYIQIRCRSAASLNFEGLQYIQVVPTDPHSGDFTFWSNRGGDSDMTLSQTFDLRSIVAPIELSFWTWYDIEQDYDYLYLLASIDDGRTWEILTTPSGTAYDPSGNSYGWAYNGHSGGGSAPIWIEEQVDLTRFAGEELTLRFEYITDTAVNGEGFLLDDVRIDALDYSENFEGGNGGWQAEGFVRLYNTIPQAYRVVLIERGETFRIREIQLDPDSSARVPLHSQEGNRDVILMVMATSRYSWQPAPYQFRLELSQ